MRKGMHWGIVLLVTVLAAGTALAVPATTEDAIEYRQAVMTVMGAHFTDMGAMVKGGTPYAKEDFEKNANIVATLIPLPWDAFMMAGSDKGSGMKSEALTQKEKFMELARAAETEVGKLTAAAKSGDMGAIKPQFGAAGGSCKTCHDAYRSK